MRQQLQCAQYFEIVFMNNNISTLGLRARFHNQISVIALIALTFCPSALSVEFYPPVSRIYISDPPAYFFKTLPNSSANVTSDRCIGILSKSLDFSEVVWSRRLENKVAPLKAFVRHDGEFVTTIGEWNHQEVAEDFAVAIYNRSGARVTTIPTEEMSKAVNASLKRRLGVESWYANAVFVFCPKDLFCIRLQSRRLVIFELSSGQILKENSDGDKSRIADVQKYLQMRAPSLARRLLASESRYDIMGGIKLCSDYMVTNSIPKLRTLLDSRDYDLVGGSQPRKTFPIRQAAVDALRMLGQNVEGVQLDEAINANPTRQP